MPLKNRWLFRLEAGRRESVIYETTTTGATKPTAPYFCYSTGEYVRKIVEAGRAAAHRREAVAMVIVVAPRVACGSCGGWVHW